MTTTLDFERPGRRSLSWGATVADSREDWLDLVWSELRGRHPSSLDLEALIGALGADQLGYAIDEVADAAFRAGFASAAVVDRLGWPESEADCGPLLQAIVEAAGVDQVAGHVEGHDFVPTGEVVVGQGRRTPISHG